MVLIRGHRGGRGLAVAAVGLLAVHVGHEVFGHEAGEYRHHHLMLDLYNVLGQSVDSCSYPSCHRQGILCIREIFLQKHIGKRIMACPGVGGNGGENIQ